MDSPGGTTAPIQGCSKSHADSANAPNSLISQHSPLRLQRVRGENPFPDQEIQENLFLACAELPPAGSDSSLSRSGRNRW